MSAVCPGAGSQSITRHRPHTGDQFEVSSEPNAHVIRPMTRNVTFCQVRLLLKVFTSDPVAMETSALTVIADECVKFGFGFFLLL